MTTPIPDLSTLREVIASAWKDGEQAAREKVAELLTAERTRISPRVEYLRLLRCEMRAFEAKEAVH